MSEKDKITDIDFLLIHIICKRSIWVEEWLVLVTSVYKVPDYNPAGDGIQPVTVCTLLHKVCHFHTSAITIWQKMLKGL